MSTPLYDALCAFAREDRLRMHMPGHKGRFLPAPELAPLAAIDFTELPPTGNLYEDTAPFRQAQALWAEEFGFDHCQFLTGGSTMGVCAGLGLLCRPGDAVLVDRNCHRSVFHAAALLDLRPVYLERPWLKEDSLIGPVSPAGVEALLDRRPDIKTVCITSPTYAGVLSDVGAIARIVHARGGKLFVDGAHGAHLPFLGLSLFSGADAVAVSAHKTLPAMGQAALLFTNGTDPEQVRRAAALFGTSSPSYPILASLDLARDYMAGEEGRRQYRRAAARVAQLRRRWPSLGEEGLSLDPTRLTLRVKDGPGFSRRLQEQGIWPEMEDGGHVVMICTAQDSEEDFDFLEQTLEPLRPLMGGCPSLCAPPLPQQVLSPRQALFSPGVTRPLEQCEGEVSACLIAPYPPGVPLLVPGERIDKKLLAYLEKIGYNNRSAVIIL